MVGSVTKTKWVNLKISICSQCHPPCSFVTLPPLVLFFLCSVICYAETSSHCPHQPSIIHFWAMCLCPSHSHLSTSLPFTSLPHPNRHPSPSCCLPPFATMQCCHIADKYKLVGLFKSYTWLILSDIVKKCFNFASIWGSVLSYLWFGCKKVLHQSATSIHFAPLC